MARRELFIMTAASLCFSSCRLGSIEDSRENIALKHTGGFFAESPFEKFSSCDEIREYQKYLKAEIDRYYGQTSASNGPVSDGAIVEEKADINVGGETNLQVDGVDEADFVKTSADHIFIANVRGLIVLDRESRREIGVLDVIGPDDSIFILGNKLIQLNAEPYESSAHIRTTKLKYFSLTKGAMPKELKALTFDGQLNEVRLRDNNLIFTTNVWIGFDTEIGTEFLTETKNSSGESRRLSCTDVFKPAKNVQSRFAGTFAEDSVASSMFNPNLSFVAIHAVSFSTDELSSSSLAFEKQSSRDFFMSKDQIIVTANHYEPSDGNHEFGYFTSLSQIKITDDGRLLPLSSGKVPGRIIGKWALFGKGVNSPVFVATTMSVGQWSQDRVELNDNRLYALQGGGKDWRELGHVKGIAPGETIKAVRYLEDKAYVVTFREVDPLFVIDIANPAAMKIKGELKVPGFSTLLQPLKDGILLGTGYAGMAESNWSSGFQISLFEIDQNSNPFLLDSKVIEGKDSSSEAQVDHHAIYFNGTTMRLGLPFTEVVTTNPSPFNWGGRLADSGAVIYNLSSKHLSEEKRMTLRDLLPDACNNPYGGNQLWWRSFQYASDFDIRRVIELDGDILAISQFGLRAFDSSTLEGLSDTRFSKGYRDCSW